MSQKTKDYSEFRNIEGNRKLIPGHVARLVEAIERKNLLPYFPVLVNDEMEVIDGQHRLAAAAQLDYDVYFDKVPGLKIEDVMQINTASRSWSIQDFVDAYIELDKPDYKRLQKFATDHRLSLSVAAELLWGVGGATTASPSKIIKEGNFVVRNEARANRVVEYLDKIEPYCDFIARSDRRFVRAIWSLAGNDQFDVDRLVAKMRLHGLRLGAKTNTRYHLLQIEDWYSFKSRAKVELYKSSYKKIAKA